MQPKTVRSTLFFSYSLIILLAFVTVAVLYSVMQVPELKSQTFTSLSQNTGVITSSMDRELDQMNTVALNIAYSSLVRNQFFNTASGNTSEYAVSSQARELQDILASLIFPNRAVDQINLYSVRDDLVSSGLSNRVAHVEAAAQPWYSEVSESKIHQAFLFTGEDSLISKYSTDAYSKQFVSFSMQNYNSFNNPFGYIEIKQRLSRIVSAAINYTSVYGESIYIFDQKGNLLYPLGENPDTDLYRFAKEKGFPDYVCSYPAAGQKMQFVCSPSTKSGFCTVAVIEEQKLLQPVYRFILNIALITVISFFIAMLTAFYAARRFTAPLGELCQQITSINIENPVQLPPLKTNLTEINSLHDTFARMQDTLSDSVSKQMMLQSQEMQSRMLALQSQMNPHFLFNSLSAIQAMADEGLNEDITVMCQSMSSILRYISSNKEQEVPLSDELTCTKDFLICMKIRYQGDLSFSINIPENMSDIRVPKLCLQLLVENAIKFTSSKRPPYQIRINGSSDAEHFELSVKDNGPGFTKETLEKLQNNIQEINKTGILPSLEINGMGLLNVYIRLRLLHNNYVIFRMQNNEDGGACVTIGAYHD